MDGYLAVSVALVFSNVLLIPPIWLAWWLQMIDVAAVLIGVMIASFNYHMCLAEWACLDLSLGSLRIGDHLMAYVGVIVMVLILANATHNGRILGVIISISVLAPIITDKIDTNVPVIAAIIISAVLFVLNIFYVIITKRDSRGKLAFYLNWKMGFFALILLIPAIVTVFFAGDPSDDRHENIKYIGFHALWHALSAIGFIPMILIVYRHAIGVMVVFLSDPFGTTTPVEQRAIGEIDSISKNALIMFTGYRAPHRDVSNSTHREDDRLLRAQEDLRELLKATKDYIGRESRHPDIASALRDMSSNDTHGSATPSETESEDDYRPPRASSKKHSRSQRSRSDHRREGNGRHRKHKGHDDWGW